MTPLDDFDAFLVRQRLRIHESLQNPTPIVDRRNPKTGTDHAGDAYDPMLKAYIRRETVGHQTPTGRKERNRGL